MWTIQLPTIEVLEGGGRVLAILCKVLKVLKRFQVVEVEGTDSSTEVAVRPPAKFFLPLGEEAASVGTETAVVSAQSVMT